MAGAFSDPPPPAPRPPPCARAWIHTTNSEGVIGTGYQKSASGVREWPRLHLIELRLIPARRQTYHAGACGDRPNPEVLAVERDHHCGAGGPVWDCDVVHEREGERVPSVPAWGPNHVSGGLGASLLVQEIEPQIRCTLR